MRVHKIIKDRSLFPKDDAASNLLYLMIMNETKTALDQEIPLPLELTRRSDEINYPADCVAPQPLKHLFFL